MSEALPKVKNKRERYKEGSLKVRKSEIWSQSYSPDNSNSPESSNGAGLRIPVKSSSTRSLNSFSQYVDEKQNFTTEEIIPDRIEGFYTYDYNICKIDEILIKKFTKEKRDKVKECKILISEELEKMQMRQNMIERKRSKKKIAEWEQMIERWDKDLDYKNYKERTGDLLKRYRELGTIKQIVSFANNSKDVSEVSESPEQQKVRHQIIFEYLEQARKYIGIDLVKQPQNDGCCFGCGNRYEDLILIENEPGITVCPVCGLEIVKVVKKSMYSDGQRVSNVKNSYEDRANFEKVLLRFQGKQVSKPDGSLYQRLDDWFQQKNLPSMEQYQKMSQREKVENGATKELMYQALSEIGCSGYYDDINLVCHIFYGLPLPDIGHLHDDVMRDYDDFQEVYDNIDKEGRKSSLNSQWKLYILLRRRGWKCTSRDFKIPTTPHIINYHKIITKQIYEELGWECNY